MNVKNNLLDFLFGESQIRQDLEGMEDDLTRLFEDADKEEADQSLASKTDLESALKEIGLEAESFDEDPAGRVACFVDHDAFAKAVRLVHEPDNMQKLAELGWVAVKIGDVAMQNEPADYRLRFLEIADSTSGITNDDKGPKQKDIAAKGQERDTTEQDRDSDELNPVETEHQGSDDKQKGVGKAKDGEDPEGTPKGSKGKTNESRARSVVQGLLEDDFVNCGVCDTRFDYDQQPGYKEGKVKCPNCGQAVKDTGQAINLESTMAGDIPPLEMGASGDGLETKGRGGNPRGRKFKTPGQWKQKPAVTPKKKNV